MIARAHLDRRLFLRAAGLGVIVAGIGCAAEDDPIADIEAELGGRVGVLALDTADGRSLAHRADERFAMCSTFKWLLAACVLRQVERGELALDRQIAFDESDLLDYAPVAKENVDEGSMRVDALCAAAVSVSDNTAANLLLGLVGGPDGLTAFLRESGDDVSRLDRIEPALNTNLPGDERDTTTPRAMVGSMQRIILGDVLRAAQRDLLIRWLRDSVTGASKLRGGLPPDWITGDKTGAGANGASNDVAIAWPPGRAPVLIASYLSGSTAEPAALNAAHAAVAAAVADRLG